MSFIYLTLHPWGSRRDQWFSPDSSTNKTDRHDIAEILLKAMLNTLTPNSACFTNFFSNCLSIDEFNKMEVLLKVSNVKQLIFKTDCWNTLLFILDIDKYH